MFSLLVFIGGRVAAWLAGRVDNVDYPQSRGPAIVDIVDNLKANCPQCPQIGLGNSHAGRGRGEFVDKLDNVDNRF